MAIWDDVIGDSDKEALQRAGFGAIHELGSCAALAIIDCTYNFVGERAPLFQSMERYPLSCGELAWKAVDEMAVVLAAARSRKIPVIYSVGDRSVPSPWRGTVKGKQMRAIPNGNDVVAEIAPVEGDMVIRKTAPSIFFGTPLAGLLLTRRIDTLFCCGGVTSGCVRASVTDAASYGLRVGVIEECTFDRSEVCHKVNLFDIHNKYGTVLPAADFRAYLKGLGENPRR